MIIYIDLVANVELASDSFDESDPIKGIKSIQSKRITVVEKEADIGANASADTEEDESVEASEEKTVINVVHAASLQKVEISDVKEYKKSQKAYWKQLLDALNKNKYKALGIKVSEDDDKDSIKEKEEKAKEELSKFELADYQKSLDAIATFKANFDAVNKFINDEIIAHFGEFEFYVGQECVLGESMIIPARYIGEATTPVFYFFTDGIKFKKE